MLPVKLMNTVPAHLRRPDDSLLDQARQAPADADLRTARRQGGNLAHRHGFTGTGEHSQDRPVESGGHRPRGITQVHDPKVYGTI